MWHYPYYEMISINTLKPRQNGQHFVDAIFKYIFFNENVWTSIIISLELVPRSQIDNIQALVQIIAWYRPGDKPLSEPMMFSLLTHVCLTRPQWVNAINDKGWLAHSMECCFPAALSRVYFCHNAHITIYILEWTGQIGVPQQGWSIKSYKERPLWSYVITFISVKK